MTGPDPELDDDDRALLVRVRALRDDGVEPAWDQFERALARKLDAEEARPTRRWWRRLWRPALGLALAGAAVAALLLARRGDAPAPARVAEATIDAAAPPLTDPPVEVELARPLALGSVGELEADELDADVVDEVLAELAGASDADDELARWTDLDDAPEEGLVPDLDLEWVDQLEDDELEAVSRWLDDEAG